MRRIDWRERNVDSGIGAMEVIMRITVLLTTSLSVILSTTGCEPNVAGYGVLDFGDENKPQLKEETQRLKAARAESRAKIKSLYSPTTADWEAIVEPESVTILELMNFPGDTELVNDKALDRLLAFKGLKTLVIGCPAISDRGLKTISELKALEALVIYDGEITDDGVQILKALPKMRTLGIFGTRVTSKGIDRLNANFKDASIELWGIGDNGKIFDANGCLTSRFLTEHRGLVLKSK